MIKSISKNVSELMNLMTQKDCKDLKELIISNPEAPLLVFVGEEACSGEYTYESAPDGFVCMQEITLYGDMWLDREDFENNLREDMSYDESYENLSEKDFDAEVAKIVAETAFVSAIVLYVG